MLPNEVRLNSTPNAPGGEARPTEKGGQAQLAEGLVQGVCGAPPAVPKLARVRKKHGLETLKDGELFFSAQLASFLKELFKLESTSAPTPDEPESRPARAVKRHRSPTELDTTYPPSVARSGLGCALQEACESMSGSRFAIQGNLLQSSLDEARMGSGLRSTPPAGLQSRGDGRESSAARAD
ncbi:hypothetical protein ERJ75_001160300 [Trypanosoma vivax]|nr:hypothetical protein ERJ75_001160300 [Trypanosoma vivax]